MALHLLVCAPVSDDDKKKLESTFDTVHYGTHPKPGTPPAPIDPEILQKTTSLLAWTPPENVNSRSDLPNLTWQMTPSAGADRLLKAPFWLDEETKKSVTLTNNSGVHCGVIPPYVVSMANNLFTRVKENLESQIVGHKWEKKNAKQFYIRELSEATWGILGYGRIGRETARLAKAFRSNVIAATSDGTRKPDHDSEQMCPGFGDPDGSIPSEIYSTRNEKAFTEFLNKTDILVVTLPGTKATNQMINSARLKQLKEGAVVVNIGRGEVVDTEALISGLESGHLSGAALDVTDPEPLPDGHKLWSMDNVIITPHISGLTERYMSRTVDMMVVNAKRVREGKDLLNQVDLVKGY